MNNFIYIEGAAALVAAGVATPIVMQMRAKSKQSNAHAPVRSVKLQFEDDDLREANVSNSNKIQVVRTEKTKAEKPKKNFFGNKNANMAKVNTATADPDDMVAPGEVIQIQKTLQKPGFFGFFNRKPKAIENPMITDGNEENGIPDFRPAEETSIREKQKIEDDEDDLVFVSPPKKTETTVQDTAPLKHEHENPAEEDEFIPIPRIADLHDDLSVKIPKSTISHAIIDEDEDHGLILKKKPEEEERERWLREAASLYENEESEENPSGLNVDRSENENHDNYEKKSDRLHDVVSDEDNDNSEILTSYQWPTFMGMDAQSLGSAERENLILLLRNMRDPAHFDILTSAFQEEKSDGLRPKVLEALIHSYHDPVLASIYDYCLEYGNDEEKDLAKSALEQIAAA